MINRKALEEKIFLVLMKASAVLIVFIVVLILASIISKGFSSINWAMITQTPKGGYYLGKEGGILNAIIGSFYIAGGATLLAVMAGVPIVMLMNVFLKNNSKVSAVIRLCFDVLWGVPSIVYGAFGFTLMILLGMKASLLAGIIVVTLLVLPIIVRAIDEVSRTVPEGLIHASLSLGATKLETGRKVITRQILPGILTAILIAFGRAIGDAASVLFTAGYSDSIPTSLFDSAATLPLTIFFQLSSPIKEVQDRAFAAVLVLTMIVLCISLLSRLFTNRYNKYKI
jgi:phosphate transport system permease protein